MKLTEYKENGRKQLQGYRRKARGGKKLKIQLNKHKMCRDPKGLENQIPHLNTCDKQAEQEKLRGKWVKFQFSTI